MELPKKKKLPAFQNQPSSVGKRIEVNDAELSIMVA
jgi:hypothetical protein